MNRQIPTLLLTAATAALALGTDLTLKAAARQELPMCSLAAVARCRSVALLGPVSLLRVTNADGGFNLSHGWLVWALVAVGLWLIPIYTLAAVPAAQLMPIAAGLQFGGTMGNLADPSPMVR